MKECPFCGSSAELKTSPSHRDGPGDCWVQCICCGAKVGSSDDVFWLMETDPTKQQDAIDNWNKRI